MHIAFLKNGLYWFLLAYFIYVTKGKRKLSDNVKFVRNFAVTVVFCLFMIQFFHTLGAAQKKGSGTVSSSSHTELLQEI